MITISHNAKRPIIFILLVMLAGNVFAAFTITKYTINNGGAKMTGGSYEMNASVGQVDASPTQSGVNYSLNGGFWHQNTDLIFKNSFE